MKIGKTSESHAVGIVDLFSGPGGLGEGFSAFETESGEHPYQIQVSIEKEPSAHSTLLLRSFLRKFGDDFPEEYYDFLNGQTNEPDWGAIHPAHWMAAREEALCMALGDDDTRRVLSAKIRKIKKDFDGRTLLIGGPPCQAYSLAGRSRNAGKADYVPHLDERNFLYEEYVNVLAELEPIAFVMENVKGMLSASIKGKEIFSRVKADLESAGGHGGYRLFALGTERGTDGAKPEHSEFIIRAENYSIPQARHRVIIVGVRNDVAESLDVSSYPTLKSRRRQVSVNDMISGMPQLRSGISKGDSEQGWRDAVVKSFDQVNKSLREMPKELSQRLGDELSNFKESFMQGNGLARVPGGTGRKPKCEDELKNWIVDSRLKIFANADTRGHMQSDLARYMFAAVFCSVLGRSPTASEFPSTLAPAHKNWKSGKFADRFRVQAGDRPSTTITSHISKDGNYFIHPDPEQCRTLTVREAARLQTFPDNYFFKGNRTQQYVQVGNAVPPFLAFQIAAAIWPLFARY